MLNPKDRLFSPYVWFGGKRKVISEVWKRLGKVTCYVEPFFGSGAMLLGRPRPFEGKEIINDADDFVCNFWRAIREVPDEVAAYADAPAFESDKHAKYVWLVQQRKDKPSLRKRLEGDPDYYDARIAGYWVWLQALWLGSGFCSDTGPWQVNSKGCLVKRRKIDPAKARISRQLPYLGTHGMRSNDPPFGSARQWFEKLGERLKDVVVCCGDWTRICGGKKGESLSVLVPQKSICGIFLDPPYLGGEGQTDRGSVYGCESLSIAARVREWAVDHGGKGSKLKIALCGYANDYEMPTEGDGAWGTHDWKATGGYSAISVSRGKQSSATKNCARERIWFSPSCEDSLTLSVWTDGRTSYAKR